jgi:hypothetical protein
MMRLPIVLAGCLIAWSAVSAQPPVVNRGLHDALGAASGLAGWDKPGHGFVAATFRIGASGEVWIIDHIRTWAAPDSVSPPPSAPGDLYSAITLYGGIEMDPVEASQCACHGLTQLKSVRLQPGGGSPIPGVTIASSDPSATTWQIDFSDLHWSVPGGMNLQFGVMGIGRPTAVGASHVWLNPLMSAAAESTLDWFDEAGKPLGHAGLPQHMTLGVQVWAHLSAAADK